MLQARRPLHQADGLDGAIINANRALSQAGPVFWVTFYGLALILAIVLGTSLIIGNVRDHEINRSEKELESMVRLLSKQFDGQIDEFRSGAQVSSQVSGIEVEQCRTIQRACFIGKLSSSPS